MLSYIIVYYSRPLGPDADSRLAAALREALGGETETDFLGNSLWTQEFHPLRLRTCLSQRL